MGKVYNIDHGCLHMNWKAFLVFFALLGVFALSRVSAYGYYSNQYNDGYYDSYSSQISRSSGYYGGPRQTTSTGYDKTTSMQYLPYGGYEQTTHYMKTTRVQPDRYSSYYGYSPSYRHMQTGYYPRGYGYPRYSSGGYSPYNYQRTYYYYPYDGRAIFGY